MAKNQLRLMRLLALLMCVLVITPILAQGITAEPPTDLVVETVTETATDVPTDVPTALPTIEVTAAPTELPTEIPTAVETATPDVTPTGDVTVAPVETVVVPTAALTLPAEPALDLVIRDLFQDAQNAGVLSSTWTVPSGWSLVPVADGFAVQIDAAAAGLASRAAYQDAYNNVAVMGYFTFVNASGAAQFIVRESSAGAYIASLDASGLVTLVKQDASGTVTSVLGTASVTATDAARGLRVSVMGDVLRVAVDNVEVIAVQDALALPAGALRVGVTFPAPVEGQSVSGIVQFDNFFLWLPTGEAPIVTPTVVVSEATAELTATPPAPIVTATAVTPTVTAVSTATVGPTGKSLIPRRPAPVFGVLSTTNDNFANRLTAATLLYGFTGDSLGNTKEIGEPSPTCGFNITNTAWFQYTPAVNETVIFSTFGSAFDTVFQVYTGSTLANLTPVAGGCGDDTATTLQGQISLSLIGGTAYTIQVGGYNGSVGVFSFYIVRPANVTLPSAPVISTANNGLANAGITNQVQPNLAWNAAGTVVPYAYDVEVATTSTFLPASIVATNTVLEPVRFSQVTPALLSTPGTTYYWHVRAKNFLGQAGAWSVVYNFKLDTDVPPPLASLSTPADNAITALTRPTFTWPAAPAASGASGYVFQISQDNFATLVMLEQLPTTTTFTIPATLPYLQQGMYKWRVLVRDAAGNRSDAPTSPVRTLIVNYATAPANNGVIFTPVTGPTANTAAVNFQWSSIPTTNPSHTGIKIEVATDASFTTIVKTSPPLAATAISYTTSLVGSLPNINPLPLGQYFWRIVVTGHTSPLSAPSTFIVSTPAPAAPTLAVVPLFISDTTPTFSWNAVATATSYDVELSTTATFTPATTTLATVTGLTTDWSPALTTNQLYYVRVRGVNNLGVKGAVSAVRTFTLDTVAPAVLTSLTAPADNAITALPRPTFTWPAAPAAPVGFGVNSYVFQISQDNFATFAIPEQFATTPTFTIPAPFYLQQGTYKWRVLVRDAALNRSDAPTSPVHTLIVNYATAPANDGVIFTPVASPTAAHVTFTWTGIPIVAPNTIKIEVATDASFTTIVKTSPNLLFNATTYTTSLAGSLPNINPLPLGQYFWRIVVTGHTSPLPAPRTFIVSTTAPVAPTLAVVPPFINDTTPTFSWSAVATATSYDMELSTTATFTPATTTLVTVTGLTTDWSPALTTNQVYYVRVRGINSLGVKGTVSAVRTFTLDTVAPTTAPTLSAPANNSIALTQKPTFTWVAVSGAARYEIRYGTDVDLSSVTPISVAAVSYTPTTNLLNTTYFWQVRALDAAGNPGPWSVSPRIVKITSVAGAAPLPWNYVTATPNLTWSSLFWASAYDIQVSRTLAFALADIVWSSSTVPVSATPNVTVGVSLPNGSYYWRVRGVANANQFGKYSPVRSFTVEVPN